MECVGEGGRGGWKEGRKEGGGEGGRTAPSFPTFSCLVVGGWPGFISSSPFFEFHLLLVCSAFCCCCGVFFLAFACIFFWSTDAAAAAAMCVGECVWEGSSGREKRRDEKPSCGWGGGGGGGGKENKGEPEATPQTRTPCFVEEETGDRVRGRGRREEGGGCLVASSTRNSFRFVRVPQRATS